MQIKSLIFYSKKGKKRILPFEIGQVNIITGESKTGKTAIIEIINYCLGNYECKISEGVIRHAVEWFAILLQFKDEQVFIARQNPNSLGQTTTQNIFFSNSDIVEIPECENITNNSDTETLKSFFTSKMFISEYVNTPEGETREPLLVNFKHSRFYCFQAQDLIAQRNLLFYHQVEPFMNQTIKDTLPYFLGAVKEDSMKIEDEIFRNKRELNKYLKELKEYEKIKNFGTQKIFELINEAKHVNLIPANSFSEDLATSFELLKKIVAWEETEIEITQGENENLKKLLDEKLQFEKKLSRKQDEVNAVSAFINQTSEYSSQVDQQRARLRSINLFEPIDDELGACPLCNQHIKNEIPSVSAINKSLFDLSESLKKTTTEQPKLLSYLQRLSVERDDIKSEIETRKNGIKQIYLENEQALLQKDTNLRKGKIIGRTSLYLESFEQVSDDKILNDKINLLQLNIDGLEQSISLDEKEERLASILNQINNQMTSWAKMLDIEHQEAPVRFDIKKLTVFYDLPEKSIPLNQMGSAANWISSHLLIHFALHKHFIKANRPVPRFLILDQPSQAYYPPEMDKELKGAFKSNSDETAVKQLYDFIFSITKELAPDLQIIITDHAKLNYKEFTDNIIEEWRDGRKLIPDDWLVN